MLEESTDQTCGLQRAKGELGQAARDGVGQLNIESLRQPSATNRATPATRATHPREIY